MHIYFPKDVIEHKQNAGNTCYVILEWATELMKGHKPKNAFLVSNTFMVAITDTGFISEWLTEFKYPIRWEFEPHDGDAVGHYLFFSPSSSAPTFLCSMPANGIFCQ